MARGESSGVQDMSTFQPLRERATWTKGLLWTSAATSALGVISDLMQRQNPETDSSFYASIGVVQFLLVVITAFVFIRWMYRAYTNLPSLGSTQRFRPFWAVVAWFVPILNLFRPKQIVDETWKAGNKLSLGVPTAFNFWWGAFIASNVLSNIAARMSWSAETSADVRTAATVYLVTDVVDVVCALLALHVVESVTASQERAAGEGAPIPAAI
jgi:hypothetical protein